jgi:hypothetical protein
VPECRAAIAALSSPTFWPESAKSQGFGDGVPIQIIVVATAESMRLVASHASDNILRNSHFSKENHPHD